MSGSSDEGSRRVRNVLRKTRVGLDLLAAMRPEAPKAPVTRAARAEPPRSFPVIIEPNAMFPGGSRRARLVLFAIYLSSAPGTEAPSWLVDEIRRVRLPSEIEREPPFATGDMLDIEKSLYTDNYAFGELKPETVENLAGIQIDGVPLIHKIWADHRIERCVFESVRTTKCDAARAAFAAAGAGVVWAVADTGIDKHHPHFATHDTLTLPNGLQHKDFTQSHPDPAEGALQDSDGHGTHVAGIIAGETPFDQGAPAQIHRETREGEANPPPPEDATCPITGMAPRCKLLSLKVLTSSKSGPVSNLLAAIGYLQQLNENGRNIKVHGLNISLGYNFNPEWYAAGASPLCTEVDRLARSGVLVVAAAGNGGYGTVTTYLGQAERASHGGTITDPGNAALALTVGSTHRESPHSFGVSYFSGKGPTADGRSKPDLVAPGERIISCALSSAGRLPYREDSGTSMAAPHVSGAAAAFLSVRGEFKGQPERLKAILMQSATDLGRRSDFQGAGLVDTMRALQSV
ncbi:MAG TPA: S8 family peptidase [Acetobacteraceae bacterium]|jgi:subtilisin family serine protease|nr:S8 family peptidase [Acetobacteraceae bacterium]